MSFLSATVFASAASVRSAMADRATFWLQAGGMVVNNGFWMVLWVLFFSGFREVGGWGLADMSRLIGVVYLMFGLCTVFLGGWRDLAGAILGGEIDTLLVQPGGVLMRLLTRESIPSAWGDILAGLFVLSLGARLDATGWAAAMAAVLIGAMVWLSTVVVFGSLAFWIADARTLSRDLADFTLMISMYPSSIYQGWTKVLVFTLLPAGFIAIAPAELVRHPGWRTLGAAASAAIAFPAIAGLVFGAGLRRYRRGG